MIIQNITTGRFEVSENHANPKDHEKELAELWFANLDKDAKLSDAEREIAELWFEILKGDE